MKSKLCVKLDKLGFIVVIALICIGLLNKLEVYEIVVRGEKAGHILNLGHGKVKWFEILYTVRVGV